MSEEELRAASREQWAGVAEGWARESARREAGVSGRPPSGCSRGRLEARAARVLELACGAGDVGLRAAAAVGPTAASCARTSPSRWSPWCASARGRPALDHVEARVLDAEALDVGDERFDAVLCRFGYMLMADPGRALRASAAGLAPGGRLALAVWGPAERNPWLSLLFDAIMTTLAAPPPAPGTPGPFALADHARLRALLDETGLRDVVVEDLDGERVHESLDEWWSGVLDSSGPVAAVVAHLSDEQAAEVRERALGAARAYVGEDGTVRFPARVVVATAAAAGR